MTTLRTSPSTALRSRVSGAVIEPGDPDWAAATQAFNLAFVQEPALVAIPAAERRTDPARFTRPTPTGAYVC